jgi:hypothetical protein
VSFSRYGVGSSLDASSRSRGDAKCLSHTITESNTPYTANDLGDPRIMSLRIDGDCVVGELCQLASLGHRVGHGESLAQADVRGRIIQQTRLTKGLTVLLIRVCMKLGAAGFPIFFVIVLQFPPQLARRSATQGFDGCGQPVHRCICPSPYFPMVMSFSKNYNRIFVSSETWQMSNGSTYAPGWGQPG